MIRRHLSDDQLTEACLALAEDPAVSRHLASCDACRLRQAGIVRLLEATTTAAVAEADDLAVDHRHGDDAHDAARNGADVVGGAGGKGDGEEASRSARRRVMAANLAADDAKASRWT